MVGSLFISPLLFRFESFLVSGMMY
jgi:hypothetical protein